MNKFRVAVILPAILFGLLLVSNGCKKEDNPATVQPPAVEHPPATTVTFVLLDSTGTTIVDSCVVRDTSQVHHGEAPVVGQLDLHAGTTYRGTFRLYDETQNPIENITQDIISEQDAHVFKFTSVGGIDTTMVKVTDRDLDSHGFPFGLNFKVVVAPGVGTVNGALHVILEHHDDGNKNGTEFDLDLDRDFPAGVTP
jgi:hypothetical protein